MYAAYVKRLKNTHVAVGDKKEGRSVTAVVIGAGNRGTTYADYSKFYPETFQVVGVADPNDAARNHFRSAYNVPGDKTFSEWTALCALGKFADVAIIATPDRKHKAPAVKFASKGYHILLEKPMATTADECKEIVQTCKENGVMLAVCHVLRYSPQARIIKELIENGVIGDVLDINHREPVGWWHYAHSYVRGNWHNESQSSSSLLAKCCHDFDLIQFWMGKKKCTRMSSFGSLMHFNSENKPSQAGSRCIDCTVETTCPYSAKKIYLDTVKQGEKSWPNSVVTAPDVPDIENMTRALTSGPYGKCVYDCDNDVMSNQVVNMQYEGGTTVSVSMVACTEKVGIRQVKVSGTKGEISCDFDGGVHLFDYLSRKKQVYEPDKIPTLMMRGHNGADIYLMDAFIEAIATNNPSKILSGPEETLRSHLLVFDAERARREDRVIYPN